MKKIKKVILAYSGGLDTSVMVHWLKEKYNCEVICFAANLGQEQELKGLREKAIKTGAKKIYIEDVRDEFVKEYVFPMLKANAVYEDKYLLGTAIARPLIAKKQVEIAKKEKADAVAHGATGKGNDQVRFELTYKALAPELRIVAPWREWTLKGRNDEIKYAKKFKIPISTSKEKPYSTDRNLWHISYEGGILEDPWLEPDESMFTLTAPVSKTPNKPEYIEIYFEKGIPKKLNGKDLSPVKLIESLNKIAGKHGVGRVDIVENRLVGIKSRGVYETPAGTVLYSAHQALETITLDRDTQHFKQLVAQKFAEIIYYGKWFSNLRRSLEAFINNTQLSVTGWTRLKLFKGNCQVVGRKAKRSLYVQKLATFEEEELYNQKDAEGFINLFGLQEKVNAIIRKQK